MKNIPGMQCVELLPGANHYINTEEKDPVPPDGFIDNTVYRYRLLPNGTKELISTMDPFPEGWDSPKKFRDNRKNKDQKGEDDMSRLYNWDTLWPKAKELLTSGKSPKEVAEEIGVELTVLSAKIYREKKAKQILEPKKGIGINQDFENAFPPIKQTPTPEPETAANQEPDQGAKESAPESIPQGCPFDEDLSMAPGEELPRERKPYTISEYQEMTNNLGIIINPDNEPSPAQRFMASRAAAAQAAVNTVLNDPIARQLIQELFRQGVA